MSRIEPQKPHIPTEKPDAAYTDRASFEKLEKVLELKENVQEVLQGRGFFNKDFMALPDGMPMNHTVTRGKMSGPAKNAASKVREEIAETLGSPATKKREKKDKKTL